MKMIMIMIMRHLNYKLAALALFAAAAVPKADAQYYEIVNQLPNLLSPALSGSMNYKGYVDATATFGIGNDRANFVGVSTSQGFQYSSWFFMGAGIGVDAAMSSISDQPAYSPDYSYSYYPPMSRTRVMVPVFSDFRFNIGASNPKNISLFIDIKAGATWILGNRYLELNNGALSNRAQFLLRPSLGLRIPTNSQNPKNAMNIGVTYQLITADNSWSYWSNNYGPTLSSLGVTVGYEW